MNNNYCHSKLLCLFVTCILWSPVHANEVSKSEFLKVTKFMMMEPCNVSAYMSCLNIKPTKCKKSVNAGFQSCDSSIKIPDKIQRKNIQQAINAYGGCVTKEITHRLKLTDAKLGKCESVLEEHAKKQGNKK